MAKGKKKKGKKAKKGKKVLTAKKKSAKKASKKSAKKSAKKAEEVGQEVSEEIGQEVQGGAEKGGQESRCQEEPGEKGHTGEASCAQTRRATRSRARARAFGTELGHAQSGCPKSGIKSCAVMGEPAIFRRRRRRQLERDPAPKGCVSAKRESVFPGDKREAFAPGSCSNTET